MSMEIEATDLIKIILQFCKENGLSESFNAIQKETNVSLNILDNRDAFLDHVRSGRWDLVLPELTSLKLPKSKLEDLYEQIVLEMIELREIDTARVILRQAQVFSQMQTEDPERFIRLERLCSRTIIDVKDLYAGIGCEKRRMSIALALANELVAVPPSRLLVLIGQALKWQRQEGLLSPGGSIDLLRGAASKEMPEEDSLVSKVNVTIKFGAKNYPECATFSPDGKSLVTGSLDGFIEVWDPLSGGLRKDLPYQAEEKLMMHEASVLCLTFSSDGGILVSGDQDGILKIWKFGTGQCLRRFESAHSRGITSVTLSHDNSHILSTSYDSLIRVHGVKSGKMLKEFRGHTSYVNSAIYASDGSMVISASSDATLRIWNVKNCECELVIRLPTSLDGRESGILGITKDPRRPEHFIVWNQSRSVYVINRLGQIIEEYEVNQPNDTNAGVLACAMSPKGLFLYGLTEDGSLFCFATASKTVVRKIKVADKRAIGIIHHPSKNIVVEYSQDGLLKLYSSE